MRVQRGFFAVAVALLLVAGACAQGNDLGLGDLGLGDLGGMGGMGGLGLLSALGGSIGGGAAAPSVTVSQPAMVIHAEYLFIADGGKVTKIHWPTMKMMGEVWYGTPRPQQGAVQSGQPQMLPGAAPTSKPPLLPGATPSTGPK